ncbi:hypothetical protein [Leptospirillum ferriphilum]|uniref:Peptidase C39 domain-containing protein n=1 Tax=Leptospirillum ferriphilum TaxID=178606 RepID=A0A1V3SVY1_9BACT|nr:hypothetical protein [Leptospirillum ferriphilum]OOH71863.1 hypothetical protein BOX24_07230 [Leptospirillum ferriphilum]
MNPVVQLDRTGCAIASVAAMMGMSYPDMKSLARSLGVTPEDNALWTSTSSIRTLLAHVGVKAGPEELPFTTWERLPDLALLAIKWKIQDGNPSWHWVVFVREDRGPVVLDSKKGLRTNVRRDFGRMRPKWYIPVDVERVFREDTGKRTGPGFSGTPDDIRA